MRCYENERWRKSTKNWEKKELVFLSLNFVCAISHYWILHFKCNISSLITPILLMPQNWKRDQCCQLVRLYTTNTPSNFWNIFLRGVIMWILLSFLHKIDNEIRVGKFLKIYIIFSILWNNDGAIIVLNKIILMKFIMLNNSFWSHKYFL